MTIFRDHQISFAKMTKTDQTTAPLYLGIECGGTRSIALLSDSTGKQFARVEAGSANVKLLSDPQLNAHFRKIDGMLKNPRGLVAIAIGMAGARTETDRQRILMAAEKVWPDIPCYATNDLETALAAAESVEGETLPRVLILSGTGSCCFGKTADGKKSAKVGGWGHLLGDKGSGYEISLRTLKALVFYYDRDGVWPSLGQKILRSLELNTPNELIGWVQSAGKGDVASIAVEVFNAWARKDKIATDIITAAAESLAIDGVDCARHLVKPGTPVHFILAGSLPLKQPKFAAEITKVVSKAWPKAVVTPLQRESVWGAVELARKHFAEIGTAPAKVKVVKSDNAIILEKLPVTNGLPVTEQRNPRSVDLDRLPISSMVELMVSEDKRIPEAIYEERAKIEKAVHYITKAFKTGGRLFYVGAGSSGRLGVLDASECPPTFRTPPEMVQGIIAGGQMALWRAVEGAEDDALAGAEAIQFNNVGKKDVVVGIAASGRTPFVWGSLFEAKKRGAITILLCFNPHLVVAPKNRPNIIIAPNVGPEVLTGSTRLKAGTATKLVLNMLTTLSMVKLGKVISNLMVDLNPSNIKLRDRAVRIVRDITGADADVAKAELERASWVVKEACRALRLKGYSARPSVPPKGTTGSARASA
jgi:N-acetylmuramic acid 6-phosphate etherase